VTDSINHLVRNRHLVEDLGGALRSGQHGLAVVPGLLKRILREESWKEFTTQRGEHVRHDRFAEFVTTPPLAGLGATVDLLRRIVADDIEAVDLLDQEMQRPVGANQHTMRRDNDTSRDPNKRGTSKDYALRRLRKDAPHLHAEVLAGKLSAHAAMVQAGFTTPRFTVQVNSADSVAATLRRRLPADLLAQVVAKLAS
jgi:hypothetical protein